MAGSAFIVGGTGQIGTAIAALLRSRGWRVTVAARGHGPVAGLVQLDRDQPGALARALGGGADLLIDTIAYDAGHADQLLAVQPDIGAMIVISSASVYRDARDRTLDEARANGFPDLPEPILETQATVEPGPATYSTRKVALERRLLDAAQAPVTILRPCAIHGAPSRHPREWWFVKRLLDGRTRIPLAYAGASRFHTSATANIAALAATVAERPGTRILNAVDPAAPSVRDIGHAVMAAIGRQAELVPVPDAGYPPRHGVSPWSIPRPFVASDAAARALGYTPVGDHAELVAPTCRWLAAQPPVDWRAAFPALAAYPWELFDYAAEDRWLAA